MQQDIETINKRERIKIIEKKILKSFIKSNENNKNFNNFWEQNEWIRAQNFKIHKAMSNDETLEILKKDGDFLLKEGSDGKSVTLVIKSANDVWKTNVEENQSINSKINKLKKESGIQELELVNPKRENESRKFEITSDTNSVRSLKENNKESHYRPL